MKVFTCLTGKPYENDAVKVLADTIRKHTSLELEVLEGEPWRHTVNRIVRHTERQLYLDPFVIINDGLEMLVNAPLSHETPVGAALEYRSKDERLGMWYADFADSHDHDISINADYFNADVVVFDPEPLRDRLKKATYPTFQENWNAVAGVYMRMPDSLNARPERYIYSLMEAREAMEQREIIRSSVIANLFPRGEEFKELYANDYTLQIPFELYFQAMEIADVGDAFKSIASASMTNLKLYKEQADIQRALKIV